MSDNQNYINLINDIITKQTVILGPDIVTLKARSVKGLILDSGNKATSIEGDPQTVLQNLINEYVNLSGQIVKNILIPVLAKYPEIKISMN